ncbi:hypothetical protein D3C85_1526750 [compost metagenome]
MLDAVFIAGRLREGFRHRFRRILLGGSVGGRRGCDSTPAVDRQGFCRRARRPCTLEGVQHAMGAGELCLSLGTDRKRLTLSVVLGNSGQGRTIAATGMHRAGFNQMVRGL